MSRGCQRQLRVQSRLGLKGDRFAGRIGEVPKTLRVGDQRAVPGSCRCATMEPGVNFDIRGTLQTVLYRVSIQATIGPKDA